MFSVVFPFTELCFLCILSLLALSWSLVCVFSWWFFCCGCCVARQAPVMPRRLAFAFVSQGADHSVDLWSFRKPVTIRNVLGHEGAPAESNSDKPTGPQETKQPTPSPMHSAAGEGLGIVPPNFFRAPSIARAQQVSIRHSPPPGERS